MNTQPTPAALRAASQILLNLKGGMPSDFDRRFVASAIDAELSQERERARELEYALKKLGEQLDERFAAHTDEGIAVAIERALSILAQLRADRGGSK
jgi:hypothetical protein